MNSITGRLIKGSMWLVMSRAVANGLGTLSTIILAWNLTPLDFGLVALGTTMLMIVTAVTELSLAQALIRHKAPTESHFSAAWTLNATRGLLICLLFAICAYPASVLYEEPRLFGIMLALGLSVLISGFTNPRQIMLQRNLIFWQEFVLSVSQKLAGFVASVVIAMIYHSYWALVMERSSPKLQTSLFPISCCPSGPGSLFNIYGSFFLSPVGSRPVKSSTH